MIPNLSLFFLNKSQWGQNVVVFVLHLLFVWTKNS